MGCPLMTLLWLPIVSLLVSDINMLVVGADLLSTDSVAIVTNLGPLSQHLRESS